MGNIFRKKKKVSNWDLIMKKNKKKLNKIKLQNPKNWKKHITKNEIIYNKNSIFKSLK